MKTHSVLGRAGLLGLVLFALTSCKQTKTGTTSDPLLPSSPTPSSQAAPAKVTSASGDTSDSHGKDGTK